MSDIVDNPEEYFGRLVPRRDQLLIDLEAEANREEIPIIGPVVGQLLSVMACATGAKRILELGTATGYSAIFLARGCRDLNGSVLWGILGIVLNVFSLGIIYIIYIGIQGRDLAWRNRRFTNVQQFVETMNSWNTWGLVLGIMGIVGIVLYFVFVIALVAASEM